MKKDDDTDMMNLDDDATKISHVSSPPSDNSLGLPPQDLSTDHRTSKDPDKPIRRLRGNPRGGGAPLPMGFESPKVLKQDLIDFGFSPKQVRAILARRPAFEVDATAQRPQGHKVFEAEQAAEREKREEKRARKGPKYEPLHLVQGSNWALYDPLQRCPSYAEPPPELFERYATYAAGNMRILEYNAFSQSVRISSAPQLLQANAVEYTMTGPRLVEIKRKGRMKGGIAAAGERAKEERQTLDRDEPRLSNESETSGIRTSESSKVKVKIEADVE